MQQYRTKITEIVPLVPGKIELTVELLEPTEVQFQAGQFMQFMLEPGVVRAYSIVNAPEEHNSTLAFCIGLIEGGKASQTLAQKKVGDSITMRGPSGLFTVKDFEQRFCFVANGVGVAPFASVIPDMLMRGYSHPAALLFGVRQENDLFYTDKFEQLSQHHQNFSFIPTLSQPKNGWAGSTGRVTAYLQEHYGQYNDCLFYLCGSIEMVKETRQLLLDKGHDPRKIKLEIFN